MNSTKRAYIAFKNTLFHDIFFHQRLSSAIMQTDNIIYLDPIHVYCEQNFLVGLDSIDSHRSYRKKFLSLCNKNSALNRSIP